MLLAARRASPTPLAHMLMQVTYRSRLHTHYITYVSLLRYTHLHRNALKETPDQRSETNSAHSRVKLPHLTYKTTTEVLDAQWAPGWQTLILAKVDQFPIIWSDFISVINMFDEEQTWCRRCRTTRTYQEGPFTKSGWTFRVINWNHSREHSDLIYDNICIS